MKKKTRKKNTYFTKVHEQAIIDYAITDDRQVRSTLYISLIGPAFNSAEINDILVTHHTYESDRENHEFWQHLFAEIDSWEKLKLKDNEKKVLEAIRILFNSNDEVEIFNKKAIYLYMREITGLNTKQIVNNLNRMRERYRNFKKQWEKGNV